jgi:hypothetical protein
MHEREFTGAERSLAAPAAAAEREAAAPLDGRQIFFLFIGSALCACLIFAAGVVCGRRVERRATAAAQTATVTDPLAVLDEIANAEEALTFHRALLDRPSGRSRPGEAGAEPDVAAVVAARTKAYGPAKPRFTLQGPLVAKSSEAEPLSRRLREAGYRPTLIEVTAEHKPTQYRLQVGDFPSPEIALSLKSELLTRYQLRATIAPF